MDCLVVPVGFLWARVGEKVQKAAVAHRRKVPFGNGTVQSNPTFAPPTKEKLAQTKKKWDL